MTTELAFKNDHGQPFELVLVTRDAEGTPTGKKQFISDDPYKIWQSFLRNKGKPKKRTAEPSKDSIKTIKQHGSLQSYVDITEREIKDDDGESRNSK